MRFATAAALAVLWTPFQATAGPAEGGLETTYPVVRESLARIKVGTENGTGFVIKSTPKYTYILTAGHVVKGGRSSGFAFFNDAPNNRPVPADVVFSERSERENPKDALTDIALLRVTFSGARVPPPPLYIAHQTTEGTAVAVAGYADLSWDESILVHEIRPSLNSGVIGAVRRNGRLIETNASNDSGQSGGPLFQTSNGYVVGLVHGSYKGFATFLYVGYNAIHQFLEDANRCLTDPKSQFISPRQVCNNHVPTPRSETVLPLPSPDEVASAHIVLTAWRTPKVVFSFGVESLAGVDATIYSRISERLIGARELTSALNESNVVPVERKLNLEYLPNQPAAPRDEASMVCAQQSATAIVVGDVFVGNDARPRLKLHLLDCDGLDWSDAYPEAVGGTIADPKELPSAFVTLLPQALAILRTQVQTDLPSSFANLLTYGLYLGSGEKRAFFKLAKTKTGAVVISAVSPRGCAGRAGLQPGDEIVSLRIPGHPPYDIEKNPKENWPSIIGEIYTPSYVMDIRPLLHRNKVVRIEFGTRDLDWYLIHKGDLNLRCAPEGD